MPFTHLHVHTQYSLLDGAARMEELVASAKKYGMNALAITDHGGMYGVVEFYKACKDAGIKPIIGMEAYVAPRFMEEREGAKDREYAHLVLLCKNNTGYKNLMRLSSEGFLRGFYYKPRIDYRLLEECAEGLVCLSACLAGDIPQRLLRGDYEEAKEVALRLKGMFGDDFYIELQNHGLSEQRRVLPGLVRIAEEIGVKTVATNDIHYVYKSDAAVQDVLLCIQTNTFVDEVNRMKMQAEEFYFKSEEEMRLALPDYPEAIENTMEVADKCNMEIVFHEKHLPGFEAPEGYENADYLQELAQKGLSRKMPEADEAAHERLAYELDIIARMGFVDYFLIVWDFIDFAKRNNIIVGPGRGSGAGSLVAYCLDITDVDPLRYGLLFERFLNPERISMPDFDIDFCYERRQEVIDYVVQKYGVDHVAQIITFGTLAARAVVRDVGRALHMPYGDVDKIAKMVPFELNIKLEKALRISPELKSAYDSDPDVQKLIDYSMRLEGLPRHASTHAAGVVISRHPVMEVVPLQKNDEAVTTQFPMGALEELGLLKMDFLGLRTLTVIRDTLEFIREAGKEVPDINNMAFDDADVYAMISAGETDGVFQLESAGMRNFMMQLRPDTFEDIIAGVALFRPGPMASIPRYVKSKHGEMEVAYAHEKLKPILKTTYGCIVYQEQVMQIARDLAGYSMGRSDLLRRAMSKKKADVMRQEREKFIHGDEKEGVIGAVKNGVSEAAAAQIFNEMQDFASYAFNKSHAACYAVLAYRTAYLRLYYKTEFMAALINSYVGSVDKVAEYVYTARNMGISVLPPDVNKSRARFGVENGAIRFGLCAVRNVGEGCMQAIVREREQNGPFADFFDFTDRAEGLNKRMLENLIYAGAFDSMRVRRAQLIRVYERAVDSAAQERKRREQGQISLFDFGGEAREEAKNAGLQLPDLPEFSRQALLDKERETIGVYLSGHPLDDYAPILKALPYRVSNLQEADGLSAPFDNERVQVAGSLRNCERKPTRSGSGIMGYGELEGITGVVDLVLFPRTLLNVGDRFLPARSVLVSGKLNLRENQGNSILVDELIPLDEVSLTLYLRYEELTAERLESTMDCISRYPGNVPVVLFDNRSKERRRVPREKYVNLSDALLTELRTLLGGENVKAAVAQQKRRSAEQ
ncbi:DNA polymerase III subunit alpha [Christensenellaceae bacterium OttesenSCG-928-L17]|nr:DNA polymerase III subunit alpha [Christensenellaceae bacterium OttesenSCG-928-L17]